MKIAFGCDHGGIVLRPEVMEYLLKMVMKSLTLASRKRNRWIIRIMGRWWQSALPQGDADFGIVICGTGIGISIAANKVPESARRLFRIRLQRTPRVNTTMQTCLQWAEDNRPRACCGHCGPVPENAVLEWRTPPKKDRQDHGGREKVFKIRKDRYGGRETNGYSTHTDHPLLQHKVSNDSR